MNVVSWIRSSPAHHNTLENSWQDKKAQKPKKNKRKADLDLGVLIDDDTDMISGATVCKSKVTISCISQDL